RAVGPAMARRVARNRADGAINGFGDAAEIDRTRAGIESEFGVKAHYLNADLSKGDDTRAFIEAAVGALGGIDILVNNAGIQYTALIEDFPTERWDAIIALNLSAVFHGTAAALPHMKKQIGRAHV